MEKKSFLILTILVLFSLSSHAKTLKYMSIGVTGATLRSEGGKSEWGKFIGFGLEYSRPSFLIFEIEAAYATKKVILENKSWQRDSELYHSGLAIGDIPIDGSFLELATKIGYHFPLFCNRLAIRLFTGSTFSFQRRYLSAVREKIQYDYDPKKGPYEFDYLRCESDGPPYLSIDGIIGIIISYKALGAEVRYSMSASERSCLRGLTINGKLDSFYILFRYAF